MALKFVAALGLMALVLVSAAPTQHGGDGNGGDHGGHGGGGGGDGGHGHHHASSHASFHLVSQNGHDEGHGHEHDGHDDGGEYHFHYGVEDHKTGDHHGHSEKRHGHHVTGHYELLDADGHKRIVHYFADKHSGFHATVNRVPTHHKPHEGAAYHGGHVDKFEEHHGHGHQHDDGHGHKGHTSEDGYSLKQEHGHAVHKHHH